MRTIDGYVCVATTAGVVEQKILFGEEVNNNEKGYENIETNRLRPYKAITSARQGQKLLRPRIDFKSVRIARLKMSYAENDAELKKFCDKKSLVVIGTIREDLEQRIYGRMVAGRPLALHFPGGCAHITDTNFTTFDDYNAAEQVASEFKRQGRMPATIGTFSLKYI